MPKRLSKRTGTSKKRNMDELAAENATRQVDSQKTEAAVTLGRLGGLKGGKARARKLSAARRAAIARKAAEARWKKQA